MKKKDRIEEYLFISLMIIFLISVSFYLPGDITGRAVEENVSDSIPIVSASVGNKTELIISSFVFLNPITMYETQNISVEVHNTGSTDYDSQTTLTIYNLSNGTTLTQLAVYVDSMVHLNPGNTRTQRVIFVPGSLGSYFIRAKVEYGPRVSEAWGSFEVIELNQTQPPPGNQTNQTNQTNQSGGPPLPPGPGPGGGGGGGGGNGSIIQLPPAPAQPLPTIAPNLSNYSMKVEVPARLTVYRNITSLLSIKAINNGKKDLNNIKLSASYPDIFEIDINPKTPQRLQLTGDEVTFVIGLYTENASLREYTFDFEIISNEVKTNGTVILDVQETPESFKKLIEEKMLNYRILISDISGEIETASRRGLDTTFPVRFIKSAIDGLNRTQGYYDASRYQDALDELDLVEKDIRDAVFTLGNLNLRLYAVQHYEWLLWVLLIAVAILIWIWYKRRSRRPRLLVRAKEE